MAKQEPKAVGNKVFICLQKKKVHSIGDATESHASDKG